MVKKMKNSKPKKAGVSRTRLATLSGVGVETIRYYERRGLIDPASKTEHTHPIYPERTLEQLIFVKRAQNTGFTLKEIVTLLSLGSDHCSVTKSLAQEKLESIKTQIVDLEEMVELLQVLIKRCNANDENGKCALFESLHDNKQ